MGDGQKADSSNVFAERQKQTGRPLGTADLITKLEYVLAVPSRGARRGAKPRSRCAIKDDVGFLSQIGIWQAAPDRA